MSEGLLQNRSVLVAEDNIISQMVVRHTLVKMGGDVDIAEDGSEAIEKLKQKDYDVILMDLQMPLINGYEATIYIRNQLKSEVPIIAMTAFAVKGEDRKCYDCGMNAYVSKPFTIESLSHAIEKVLGPAAEKTYNPYLFESENVAVDVSLLYEVAGHDETYILKMVESFLKNMPPTLLKIEQNLEAQDWENVYKCAHFAKSSLSIIKVDEMFDWIVKVELSAKNRTNLEAVPGLVEKIKAKFHVAEKILTEKFHIESYSY